MRRVVEICRWRFSIHQQSSSRIIEIRQLQHGRAFLCKQKKFLILLLPFSHITEHRTFHLDRLFQYVTYSENEQKSRTRKLSTIRFRIVDYLPITAETLIELRAKIERYLE